jgi:hypothetical protein
LRRLGGYVVLRALGSVGSIVFSLIIGALLLAYVGVEWPSVLSASLRLAHGLKEVITGTSLDPRYNVWIEFLLDDRQLVFMFYVVLARILLWLVLLPVWMIRNRLVHG